MLRLILALAVAVAAVVGVAGCGGGGSSSSESTTAESTSSTEPAASTTESGEGGAEGGELAAFEEELEAEFEAQSAEQTYAPPTSGPKAVSGKRIFVITCPRAAEGCKRAGDAMKQAAETVGWEVTLIDGEGDPSKEGAAVQQAIAAHADGISFFAIDASTIEGPLTKAKDAGIKMVCSFCENSDPNSQTGLYDANEPPAKSFAEDGYHLGQGLYKLSGGEVHQLMLTDAEYFDVRGRAAGNLKFIKQCEEVGGDCEVVDELPFLVSELGTELPSKVASAAQANPDFNILWAGYDDALIFALQGLQQAGVTGKEGAGFDANAASIERINNGEELATMGLPGTWIGFGLIDDLNRMFAGQEPVLQNIHTKLLYKGNVQGIEEGEGWNGDINVIPLYEKLWGVS